MIERPGETDREHYNKRTIETRRHSSHPLQVRPRDKSALPRATRELVISRIAPVETAWSVGLWEIYFEFRGRVPADGRRAREFRTCGVITRNNCYSRAKERGRITTDCYRAPWPRITTLTRQAGSRESLARHAA